MIRTEAASEPQPKRPRETRETRGVEREEGEEDEEGEEGGSSVEDGGTSDEDGGTSDGSVEDGGTSDEDDFPLSSRLVATAFELAGPGLRCEAAWSTTTPQLAAALADGGGAAMLCAQLDVESCAAAKQACLHLRDATDSSYLFSSPTSTRAPPCAAAALF